MVHSAHILHYFCLLSVVSGHLVCYSIKDIAIGCPRIFLQVFYPLILNIVSYTKHYGTATLVIARPLQKFYRYIYSPLRRFDILMSLMILWQASMIVYHILY